MNTEAPNATTISPRRSFALVALVVAVAAFVSVWSCGSSSSRRLDSSRLEALESWDDGTPFGEISGSDVDRLMQSAKEQGFDLSSEFQKAYAKDADALARVFTFSLTFKDLDQNARTYGHTIYCTLLNLGETMGLEQYSDVVAAQSPEVQQRVRDFLYFPVTLAPKKERAQVDKETRESAPKLFPKDYQFGHDNPLFKKLAR
jgi:hypothetical protein